MKRHRAGRLLASTASAAFALTAGCAGPQSDDGLLGMITPYRVEIVQGNVITRELAARVRPGMTRSQVRELLGSPLLTDIFHADRWDYVFTIRRQGTAPQRRSVVARFEGEQLKSLDLPQDLPSEREFVASISRTAASGQAVALELSDEQRQALPKPPAAKSEAPAAQGPARSYPPLEPQ